jgi:hypothetical protein
MVKMRRLRTALFLLAACVAEADTVITGDSSSWNGHATVSGGVLKLDAGFRTGNVTLQFGANYVRSIDFNSTVQPGRRSHQAAPQEKGRSLQRHGLHTEQNKPEMRNITVDPGRVSCDGKPILGVIRILVGN